MSLHKTVSTKTEPEETPAFDAATQCGYCGNTQFTQMLYQSYTEEKFADTNNSYADYQNLEHTDTYDHDPWICTGCSEEPEDPDLIDLLNQM